MNILLLGEWYPPLQKWYFDEGEAQGMPAVYALYEYLGAHDEHRFHGIVYNPIRDYKKKFKNGSVLELRKLSFPIYFLWKLLAMLKMGFAGSQACQRENYDLVYGLGSFAQVAQRVGKKNHLFSLGRIYGTILTKLFAEKQYFKIYTRHLFDILYIKKPCDQTICTFDGTQYDKICKALNPKMKVKLLFNGMNTNLRDNLLKIAPLTTISRNETIRFCYIARFEYYKRVHLAIELIHILKNQYKWDNISLSLLGKGTLEDKIKEQISAHGLENNVLFVDNLNHKEMPSFLADQQFSLFFYEGGSLGNVLWESTMAGRLICTIDNGATGEVMMDGVNSLVVEDNVDSMKMLAEKIAALQDEDIEKISANGRKEIKHKITKWEMRFEKEMKLIQDWIQSDQRFVSR